ncbi:putative quinol monooxygenase [Microbacterium sp. EF45047]|uniref:putative quinol monooxygenase n=1 Tax=Microbacterium sp. EF45047 TaxID=2809708 RepID=UPI00234ADCF9|nr:putative quinol monooxygenase [Microbacterium sp. EF45047]WCM56036.1 antibiotic biosynthesis monooxygenase [Microbacterium sp. EF45047]
MSDEAVTLFAEFTALRGCTEEVDALLRGLVADVRQEPGNLVFDAYRLTEEPDRFFVFEVYRDRAAFEEHLAAPYGVPFNKRLQELIVEDASQLTFLSRTAEP